MIVAKYSVDRYHAYLSSPELFCVKAKTKESLGVKKNSRAWRG
jgi:hypothetical protein